VASAGVITVSSAGTFNGSSAKAFPGRARQRTQNKYFNFILFLLFKSWFSAMKNSGFTEQHRADFTFRADVKIYR
jgi:hypothetical protein